MKTTLHQIKTLGAKIDGMCYIVQCDDGSTLVVDGGMPDGDGKILVDHLKKFTGSERPVIDAWFFTHNHLDHTGAFFDTAEMFSDQVTVKKVIHRFLSEEFYANCQPACVPELKRFNEDLKAFPGVEVVNPSAGDEFTFGSAKIEILYTAADLPIIDGGKKNKTNDTSLVFRLYAEGQTVLFLGDVQKAGNDVMIARYGDHLKSDVVQVAHHGCAASSREFYDIIDPEILLWPVSTKYFEAFMYEIKVDRHLVHEMRVKDVYLSGHGDFSLEMPIKPRVEPFLPEVGFPDRKIVPDAEFFRAPSAPSLDPSDPVWDCSPEYQALYDHWPKPGPEGDAGSFRALWDEDALYLKIRFDKKLVFDPTRFGSGDSDCINLFMTEYPVTGRMDFWEDHPGDPRFVEKLKFFAEEKTIGGVGRICSDTVRCESRHYPDPDGLTVCARVKFSSKRSPGDVIGFDLEFNGVRAPGAPRSYSLNFVDREGGIKRFGGFKHFITPSALAYVKLTEK
ncbi:MAG: MBL fold metallo-hydrolase [Clostridia bacterium]|nr:MBL fold metallo-hydrolase [Clostridia bacterium]